MLLCRQPKSLSEMKHVVLKAFVVMLAGFLYVGDISAAGNDSYVLESPDGRNKVMITAVPKVGYEVYRNGSRIISWSPLSMDVSGELWGEGGRPRKIGRNSVEQPVYFPVPRKYASTVEIYNSLELFYKGYSIEFRAYNDAVAYRFVGRSSAEGEIRSEHVRYNFPADFKSRTLLTDKLQNWFEANYTVSPLSEIPEDKLSMHPLMVDMPSCKAVITEANLYDYAGIYFRAMDGGFTGEFAYYPKEEAFFENGDKLYVTEREDYIVRCRLDRPFPWRVLALFDNEADMLASEIVYLLSEPSEGDFSWIEPGQVLWDWWNDNNLYNVDFRAGINTETYKYFIDFASENGIPYVLIDAGWSDLDNLLKPVPEMDMEYLCAYARENGVGLMLWVKWMTLDRQLDEAFSQFCKWGIKGVKIDYMDRNDAKMVNFYERIAKKASEARLLVDFHGSYPNEGMRRKYPVLMTREGVMGLEYNKWATTATPEHDVNIAYLRMFAGPMDYTPGAMSNGVGDSYHVSRTEPMSQGTRTHQMAMYVVYESPLQMLADSPTKYIENRECFDYIRTIPVTWDETIPLGGRIGETVAVARRKGDVWYIGALSGADAHRIEVDLEFLGEGSFNMQAFEDGPNADRNGKDYKRSVRSVRSSDTLTLDMAPGGGFVATLTKDN